MNSASAARSGRIAGVSRSGISYQARGEGAPVLLVHGWCLNRTVWMYQEHELLARGFQVLSVDLAGYGESQNLSGPYTLRRHGADVADLLRELRLDDVVVVGFAYGAGVALNLSEYSCVKGLVSIGVPSAEGAPYEKMRAAMLRDWPLFAHRSAKAICARQHSEESMEWLGRVFSATPLTSAIVGVDVLAGYEPTRQEQGWDVPALFVHGERDTIVSPDISTACAQRFSGARSIVIPGSGHFVPWDAPQELSDAIVDFAQGLQS